MLVAVVEDLARGSDIEVFTTWDARLAPPAWPANVQVRVLATPEQEMAVARELAASADATWIIAPETGGLLRDRVRELAPAERGRLNCSPDAIELCSDKLRLAWWLREHGIPTPATFLCKETLEAAAEGVRIDEALISWPVVVKPRDGAGSQATFLVQGMSTGKGPAADRGLSWSHLLRELADAPWPGELIVQPFFAGRAVSVAAIVRTTDDFDLLPVGDQRLSEDGRLAYRGGRLPAPDLVDGPIHALVAAAIQAMPGLYGWVGFDLLLPGDSGAAPVLIEINPRLTTSYIGYRRLAADNLAHRVARSGKRLEPLRFPGQISFSAAGDFFA